MTRPNKYEQHYREGREVCGPPFPEFVAFFETYAPQADVLDLGCGQGRDALVAARHGHRVVGVDLSETGIAQMLEGAAAEGLQVEGIVADVATWQPEASFDVIILDRVLHLLSDDGERRQVLERACAHTRPGGFVLIADTPKQQALLREVCASREPEWEIVLRRKGFVFAQRIASRQLDL